MSVQISIVHYAEDRDEDLIFNEILYRLVKSIRELTVHKYRLNIIDNQMGPQMRRDIEAKIPDVEIHRTKGIHHTFPVGANLAIEEMKEDYLVLLHTDLLVGYNWLTSLITDLKDSEKRYGLPCSVAPLLLFYPVHPSLKEKLHHKIRSRQDTMSYNALENYMRECGIPFKLWGDVPVALSNPGLVTNNGHQLGGAYVASKRFFDEVGPYDPLINRFNDKDYGIRALLENTRSLISNKSYIHHMGGLHKTSGCYGGQGYFDEAGIKHSYGSDNLGAFTQFRLKWGEKVFKKTVDGSLWVELHRAQLEGRAKELMAEWKKEAS